MAEKLCTRFVIEIKGAQYLSPAQMWKCELCNIFFEKVTKYAAHKSAHVRKGEIPRDLTKNYVEVVSCDVCFATFKSESFLQIHLKSNKHNCLAKPKNCETCKNFHDGTFGSGRFCSRSCANSSSTSKKRLQINQKVSQKLKGKVIKTRLIKFCLTCSSKFETLFSYKRYCSKDCVRKRIITEEYREQCSTQLKLQYANGRKVSGGYTKRIEVETSNGILKVQGSFEKRACLIFDVLLAQKIITSWSYNEKRFPYFWNMKHRTYLPDFCVQFADVSMFVETKGYERENDPAKWEALKKLGHKLEIWTSKVLSLYEKCIT